MMSVFNQPPRPSQPGHPSEHRQKEYWLWLQPPLWKKVTIGPLTRTAGILAYSQSKVLAVNGTGRLADVGRILA